MTTTNTHLSGRRQQKRPSWPLPRCGRTARVPGRCLSFFLWFCSWGMTRKLMGEGAMTFRKALVVGFRRWPGFRGQAPYERLPMWSRRQSHIVAPCEHHSDHSPVSEDRPSTRETNVIDSLEFRRRRQEQPRTSPLTEFALDKCEEAFERRDWPTFAYWHAVVVRERIRLNRPTRVS